MSRACAYRSHRLPPLSLPLVMTMANLPLYDNDDSQPTPPFVRRWSCAQVRRVCVQRRSVACFSLRSKSTSHSMSSLVIFCRFRTSNGKLRAWTYMQSDGWLSSKVRRGGVRGSHSRAGYVGGVRGHRSIKQLFAVIGSGDRDCRHAATHSLRGRTWQRGWTNRPNRLATAQFHHPSSSKSAAEQRSCRSSFCLRVAPPRRSRYRTIQSLRCTAQTIPGRAYAAWDASAAQSAALQAALR